MCYIQQYKALQVDGVYAKGAPKSSQVAVNFAKKESAPGEKAYLMTVDLCKQKKERAVTVERAPCLQRLLLPFVRDLLSYWKVYLSCWPCSETRYIQECEMYYDLAGAFSVFSVHG